MGVSLANSIGGGGEKRDGFLAVAVVKPGVARRSGRVPEETIPHSSQSSSHPSSRILSFASLTSEFYSDLLPPSDEARLPDGA